MCIIGSGRKARKSSQHKVYTPTKGELVTWCGNHAEKSKALEHQLVALIGKTPEIDATEFSRILREAVTEGYALGGLHADLAAGRFR